MSQNIKPYEVILFADEKQQTIAVVEDGNGADVFTQIGGRRSPCWEFDQDEIRALAECTGYTVLTEEQRNILVRWADQSRHWCQEDTDAVMRVCRQLAKKR